MLKFNDIRRFGMFQIVDTHKFSQLKFLNILGVDALDSHFNEVYLYEKLIEEHRIYFDYVEKLRLLPDPDKTWLEKKFELSLYKLSDLEKILDKFKGYDDIKEISDRLNNVVKIL